MRLTLFAVVTFASLLLPPDAGAQGGPNGEYLFRSRCATCHSETTTADVPSVAMLAKLSPNAVVTALTSGVMRLQGERLTAAEQTAIAEFVSNRAVTTRAAAFARGMCTAKPAAVMPTAPGAWNGWGPDTRNTRFQPDTGGLTAADIPRLRLKWAFGVPDVTQLRSQPAVLGNRLFIGSVSGTIYSLDASSGCTYWMFTARGPVRTAISVGTIGSGASARSAVFFSDTQARAYAVDAQTGTEIWTRKVDEHPAAQGTGAPTLSGGRLYVPISGVAESMTGATPDYACCTFRGSLTALDAATGAVIWKTYTVPESKPRGTSTRGVPLWGPAGASIWSAPTVDTARGLVYAATGNAYADPVVLTSNAVLAFSIETGAVVWSKQLLPADVWIAGCPGPGGGRGGRGAPPAAAPAAPPAERNANCPEKVGPDFDFSASPALVRGADGREVLVITQKAGLGWAIDPARQGEVVWQYRWGVGSPVGGVWGTTSDGSQVYFGVADQFTQNPGGVHAVNLATGQRAWFTPPAPLCAGRPGCRPAQSAALTAMPGVVFSGSADGGMRAYAAATGQVIWTFDTNQGFETVNGVLATGGSIDGPGPVIAGGRLFVTAGNGGIVGTPGNVLLAFEPAP